MDHQRHAAKETLMYQVEIASVFHEKWVHWLDNRLIKIEKHATHTTLFFSVPDQAALRGILNTLWDLNLTLISVTQLANKSE